MKRATSATPDVVTRRAVRFDPLTLLVEYLAVEGLMYHMKIKVGGLSSTSDPAVIAKALAEQQPLLGTPTGDNLIRCHVFAANWWKIKSIVSPLQ